MPQWLKKIKNWELNTGAKGSLPLARIVKNHWQPMQNSAQNAARSLKPKENCPNCGAKLLPNAKFCAECGEKV